MVAESLLSHCPKGGVHCDEQTRSATSRAVLLESVAALPQPTFRPVDCTAAAEELPLVREVQMGHLRDLVHDLVDASQEHSLDAPAQVSPKERERYSVAVLEGVIGSGKTRLACEMTKLAEQAGVFTIHGAGSADHPLAPLHAWLPVIGAAFDSLQLHSEKGGGGGGESRRSGGALDRSDTSKGINKACASASCGCGLMWDASHSAQRAPEDAYSPRSLPPLGGFTDNSRVVGQQVEEAPAGVGAWPGFSLASGHPFAVDGPDALSAARERVQAREQTPYLSLGTAPHCTSLHLTAPHCTSLHLTAPHCSSLHPTAPHCA